MILEKQPPDITRARRKAYKSYYRPRFIKWLAYTGELYWLPEPLLERAKRGKFDIEGVGVHHIIPLSLCREEDNPNDFNNMILIRSAEHTKIHKYFDYYVKDLKVGEILEIEAPKLPVFNPRGLDIYKKKKFYKNNYARER